MGFRQGLVYGSRRLDPEGQTFIFRAEAAGTYGLKFYKQDFVRDYILNDYVQVIVGESPEAAATGWFNPATDRGRAVAEPRWPTVAEEAEAFRNRNAAGAEGTNPADGTRRPAPPSGQIPAAGPAQSEELPRQPVSPATPPPASVPPALSAVPAGQTAERREPLAPASPPVPAETPLSSDNSPPAEAALRPAEDSPDQYLRRAREEFEAGRVAPAIALLDRFRERYPAGSDETWWLYGQFYEANSPSRDIRSSLDYYRRLLREYPQSSRCNEARKRIAYLERYYINIR
jgi:tetratricopeptide (TPR) repeat protein